MHDARRPSDLGVPELYEFMVSAVQPRPIALVATLDETGQLNLAPFSFFMVGGVNPVSLMFCPNTRSDGGDKATLKNLESNGEFVVNVVTRSVMDLTSESALSSGSEKVAALEPVTAPSLVVSTPRLSETSIQFECKLFQVLRHGTGGFASVYVIGEVVMIHAAPEIWQNPAQIKPVGRLGGPDYLDLNTLEIFRP